VADTGRRRRRRESLSRDAHSVSCRHLAVHRRSLSGGLLPARALSYHLCPCRPRKSLRDSGAISTSTASRELTAAVEPTLPAAEITDFARPAGKASAASATRRNFTTNIHKLALSITTQQLHSLTTSLNHTHHSPRGSTPLLTPHRMTTQHRL
jgi:hypothetical protein